MVHLDLWALWRGALAEHMDTRDTWMPLSDLPMSLGVRLCILCKRTWTQRQWLEGITQTL